MDNIKKLQNKLFETAIYFDNFCSEYNIKYFLAEGTALGAVRHKDFIPWDDDFDIFMLYEDYNKFIDLAEKHLDKQRFYLQKGNTKELPLYLTKVRINNTTFIEENKFNREMHLGMFIDIFCLNNIADNKIIRNMQYFSSRLLNKKASVQMGLIGKDIKGRLVSSLVNFIVCKPVKNILYKFVKMYNNKKTENVGYLFFKQLHNKLIIPKRVIGDGRMIEFRGYSLPIFEKAEEYLTLKYGKDYMRIPDEYAIKKEYPIHAVFWDTEKDYKEYKIIIKENENLM